MLLRLIIIKGEMYTYSHNLLLINARNVVHLLVLEIKEDTWDLTLKVGYLGNALVSMLIFYLY